MKDEQTLKEILSALLDGEAGKIDQLELRRLARALEDQPELLETCRRYTLARAAMRGEYWPTDSKAFLEKLKAELADAAMDEMIPDSGVARSRSDQREWLSWGGRVAIAASVAVVTVVLLKPPTTTGPEDSSVAAAEIVPDINRTTVTARNTRLIDPEVIAVGTGNHTPVTLMSQDGVGTTDCVLGEPELAGRDVMWERSLPSGYSLCRQQSGTTICEPVSTTVSCYRP